MVHSASVLKRVQENYAANTDRRVPALKAPTQAGADKWAVRMANLRTTCSRHWTDEEIRLYECQALAGWESR